MGVPQNGWLRERPIRFQLEPIYSQVWTQVHDHNVCKLLSFAGIMCHVISKWWIVILYVDWPAGMCWYQYKWWSVNPFPLLIDNKMIDLIPCGGYHEACWKPQVKSPHSAGNQSPSEACINQSIDQSSNQ